VVAVIPLFGQIGWTEVLVVAGVVFILFGATRIPAAFRSIGEGINAFKEGLEGKDKHPAEPRTRGPETPPAPTDRDDAKP
jgi:sec-independent protein translocase protein TatA